jgi:hypothetical protein
LAFPTNAQGAYYAALNFRLIPESSRGQQVVVVQPAIRIEIEALIPGPAPIRIEVPRLSFVREEGHLTPSIVLTAKNLGVWKTLIEGDVLLYKAQGGYPTRVPIPYSRAGTPIEVYPDAEVDVKCPVEQTLSPGDYRAVSRLLLNETWQTTSEFSITVPGYIGETGVSGRLNRRAEYDLMLNVKPELVELVIPSGGTRTIPISIQNQDDREAEIRVSVSDVRMESSGILTYLDTPGDVSWVTISPESLTILPGRISTLRAKAVVPTDREANQTLIRSLQIKARAQSSDPDWESVGEYGVLVVAAGPDAEPPNLTIESMNIIRPKEDANPTSAVLRVKNTGGRVARILGEFALERETGQIISELDIGQNREELILPEYVREFRMPIGPLDRGGFRVRAELRVKDQKGSSISTETRFTSAVSVPQGL